MLEVLATLQMREMMDTLCVQDTLAKSPNADISDWISSSIRSRSQILLHSKPLTQPLSASSFASREREALPPSSGYVTHSAVEGQKNTEDYKSHHTVLKNPCSKSSEQSR